MRYGIVIGILLLCVACDGLTGGGAPPSRSSGRNAATDAEAKGAKDETSNKDRKKKQRDGKDDDGSDAASDQAPGGDGASVDGGAGGDGGGDGGQAPGPLGEPKPAVEQPLPASALSWDGETVSGTPTLNLVPTE